MKRWKQTLAGCLAVWMMVCQLPVCASATDDTLAKRTLNIATAEAFVQFAEQCRYDAYSDGLHVFLTQDIDLTDVGFTGIPIFLGYFDGQGHTVSGVADDVSMDGQGLFRCIAEDATVYHLTVVGSRVVEHNTIGGIAGENKGTIQNCDYQGTVSGLDSIGGIVGVNYGSILNSVMSGDVSGERKVGGIAGENHGTILRCTNYSDINTDITAFQFAVEEQLVSNINPSSDTIDISDVGGVVGWSDGIVQSSTNRGAVGYAHVGYNIGGIVGRQSGYLNECNNLGMVLGRKEVGGIVGQFMPHVDLLYSASKLQTLREELDVLHTTTEQLANDAERSHNWMSYTFDQLVGAVATSQTQTDALLQQTECMVNQNIDAVNQVSVTVSNTLAALIPIADGFDSAVNTLGEMATALQDSAKQLGNALTTMGAVGDWANEVQVELDRGNEQLNMGMQHFHEASDALHALPQHLPDIITTLQNVATQLKEGKQCVQSAVEAYRNALQRLQEGQGLLGQTNEELQQMADALQTGMGALSRALGQVAQTDQLIENLLVHLSEPDEIVFSKFDANYDATCAALSNSLVLVQQQVQQVNTTANISGTLLIEDFRDSTKQLGDVLDLILDIMQDVTTFVEDAPYQVEDMSCADTTGQYAGTLAHCQNQGIVMGDSDVGGIAGAMSFDLPFGQEDDWTHDGDKTQRVTRQGMAVIADSINTGDVTAKKDNAGGVTGNQQFGLVQRCTANAHVESTEGGSVGGIVGSSTADIRQCFAKTTLYGSQFVAGIAGVGYHLSDCYSLSDICATDGGMGGIVGMVQEDGMLKDNYFVSDTLGGLDGVSFVGQAQAISYQALTQVETLPEMFKRMTLRFYVDDTLVDTLSVDFGGAVSPDALPVLPDKEGYCGEWQEFDHTNITSDLKIEGVYTPLRTTIACEAWSDKNDEQEIAPVLVDGHFTKAERLYVTMKEAPEEGVFQSYDIVVEGTKTAFTAIRCLAPEMAVTVQCKQDGQWVTVDATMNGTYLVIPVQANGMAQMRLLPVTQSMPWNWIVIGGIVLFGGAIFLRCHQSRVRCKKENKLHKTRIGE